MNIKSIMTSSVVNIYSKNTVKKNEKVNEVQKRDRIELTDTAKTLNIYSSEGATIDNRMKIAELKNQIENGTYNVDARLTAQSIMNHIKGKN